MSKLDLLKLLCIKINLRKSRRKSKFMEKIENRKFTKPYENISKENIQLPLNYEQVLQLEIPEMKNLLKTLGEKYLELTGKKFPYYVEIDGRCRSGKSFLHKKFAEKMIPGTDDHMELDSKDKTKSVFAKKIKLKNVLKELLQIESKIKSKKGFESTLVEQEKLNRINSQIEKISKKINQEGAIAACKLEIVKFIKICESAITIS